MAGDPPEEHKGSVVKITVIGLGHVGLVAAAGLALAGHEVLATDIDRGKLKDIRGGRRPFFEPGLSQCIASASRKGTLSFPHTDEFHGGVGEIALVAVGTPPAQGSIADLRGVRAAVSWARQHADAGLVIVMKSTVPPGTGMAILREDLAGTGMGYVANPEFLREGRAMSDWQYPDRVVIGAAADDCRSAEVVRRVYAGIDAPVLVTDITSAEMIKYASNAFLATRISFINEIASLCDSVGASIDDVSEGLAMDSRTGTRIYAGVGYGGSCLPKDMAALEDLARYTGFSAKLLRAVTSVNGRQRLVPLHALRERFGGSLRGVRVGVLGLAFKPGTDDVRDAPALDLLRALGAEGAVVAAYDPRALEPARRELPGRSILFAPDIGEASRHAEALVLMTEWTEIVNHDWAAIAGEMDPPRFIFDGRNALDPAAMTGLGFEYMGVGRMSANSVTPSGPSGLSAGG